MRRLQICLSLILTTACFGNVNVKPLPGMPFVNRAHRLGRGLVCFLLMNERSGGQVFDLSGNNRTGTFGVGVASPSWGAGKYGSVIVHDATTDRINLGAGPGFIPTDAITIVLKCKKRDATNRVSGAFGHDVGIGINETCGVHLPYSDGTVYWDFGGTTEDVTRESVAGLTFGDDIWVFTSGPRGMEIWQNGILRSFNNATPTRNDVAIESFFLGQKGATASDLVDYGWFIMYDRQISVSEVAELYWNSFGMFEQDDIALMAVEAPAPGGGQVIMITTLPWILSIPLLVGIVYLRTKHKEVL